MGFFARAVAALPWCVDTQTLEELMHVKPDFEALFNAFPYPYVLMDRDMTIIGANRAYLDATGARADEIVGRNAFAAFPPNPDDPASTDVDQVRASVRMAFSTGQPHSTPLVRYSLRREGPDGPRYENRYWSVLHTPVRNATGEIEYVAQNAIDVTDIYHPGAAPGRPAQDAGGFQRARMDEALIRALSDETSHLRDLFKQAPGFIAVFKGRACVIELANEAYYQLVGHRSIIGRPLFEALPEVAGQGYEEVLQRVFDTGEPYVGHGDKVTVQRAPGGPLSEIRVDFVYQPIVGPGGTVSGIFVQGQDVTDMHAARLAKQAADERLQHGLDAASMAVWDWDLASGRIVYSENAADVFGCPWEHVGAARDDVHPDDLPAVNAAIAHALETRTAYNVVNRVIRRDTGATVWINSRGQLLCDASGAPCAFRGVSLDITERKRAEIELERVNRALAERVAQLAQAERRQAFQLEVSDRLRRVGTPGDVFSEVCRMLARHLGVARVLCGEYDPARALVSWHGRHLPDAQRKLDGAWPAAAFGSDNFAALAAGRTWVGSDLRSDPRTAGPATWPTFEALGIAAAVVVPLSVRGPVVPCLFVGAAEPREWSADEVSLVEDISGRMWNALERARAEEALREADARKDEFLAMLAHELRNPLAPVSAAAELLRLGRLDADSIRRTSQVITRQVGHMTGLVNDLLDVSRVTRGLVELEHAVVDLGRVTADAVEQARPVIESRRHQLTVEACVPAPAIEGDHKRLVQVMANLLANAAKYTPEGGHLSVRLCEEDGQAVLRVADDGIGIAPDMLPHVFDLFAQAKRTPDRSQGGLGLGLALVRSLVELHGGSVAARSAGPGQGCEFTVRLRVLPAAPGRRQEEECGPGCARCARALRVMVVDDNADAAGMLQMLLEDRGHRVAVEHDGFAALARAAGERFDAFVLDIGLPGMEGPELARRLRATDAHRDAAFIAVTGYGQQAVRASAMQAGFDHYFVKPVDAEGLLAALDLAHEDERAFG